MGLIQNGSLDRRFFHALGASRLDETICSAAGMVGFWSCYGSSQGPPPEAIPLARLVVLWGANVLATSIHDWPFIEEARAAGAPLVVIDPLRTPTAERADWHIRIRPGTDAAFALAVAHEVFARGAHDEAWLEAHAQDWRAYRDRAATCPPERAEALCGVSAADIRRFAAMYADAGVAPGVRPPQLRPQPPRQRRRRRCAPWRCCRRSWATGRGPAAARGCRRAAASVSTRRRWRGPTSSPARARRARSTCRRWARRSTAAEPPIRALFVYSANPAASNPDQASVIRGLSREDLFTVVHEQLPTDTARYADVLLPSTMAMEQPDLHLAYGHYHVQLNRPAVAAPGECRPLLEVFRALAKRMGLNDAGRRSAGAFDASFEDLVRAALAAKGNPRLAGITLERLEAERSIPLAPQDARLPFYSPFLDGTFDTPSRRVEFSSERMRAAGVDPVLGALTSRGRGPGRGGRAGALPAPLPLAGVALLPQLVDGRERARPAHAEGPAAVPERRPTPRRAASPRRPRARPQRPRKRGPPSRRSAT